MWPRRCPLPPGVLHERYQQMGGHADCFFTDVPWPVSHAQFVEAFYTTPVFRLERLLLRWAVSKPSSDVEAGQIARGEIQQFAAWRLEARVHNQLLMVDFLGDTRSWFMVAPLVSDGAQGTRLFFGTGIAPREKGGRTQLGAAYRNLMWFHLLYSQVLLFSARRRLLRTHVAAGKD